MIYELMIAHPVLTTIIAIVAVLVVGATSFDPNDWRR
jgi:hypothetical protein